MTIASIVEDGHSGLRILDVAVAPQDRPLIEYWMSKHPSDFEEHNPLARHWLEFELSGITRGQEILKRYAGIFSVKDKIVLDVGAGNGGMCIAAALAGARAVHGIEIEEPRIDLAQKWAECRGIEVDIRQGVAESLPFADSSIEVLFLWSVIEHVEDTEKTLDELVRVLRPGGYAVINAPNRLSPKFFMKDPHYQIMAVSALPRPIAKWWVTKIRKITDHYGVGIFPVYSRLVARMQNKGLMPRASDHGNYLIDLLENPERIRSRFRVPIRMLARTGLNRLFAMVLRNTSPLFEVVVQKVG